jgi:hypothetical protein
MDKKTLSREGTTDFLDRSTCRQQDKCIKKTISMYGVYLVGLRKTDVIKMLCGLLTLSYSSKINGHLCPQRVSPP